MKDNLVFRPESSCLIVIDIQNDFFHPDGHFPRLEFWSDSYDGLIGRIVNFRDALPPSVRRVYTRTVYEADGSDGVVRRHRVIPEQFYERRAPRPRPILVRETWGAELVQQLQPRPEDVIVSKRRYSAFYGTDLETLLRSWGTQTVILVGVNAEQCVETTAREAFMRDLDVIVVSDCIGSWSQERLEASKAVVSYAFGTVADSTAIVARASEDRERISQPR